MPRRESARPASSDGNVPLAPATPVDTTQNVCSRATAGKNAGRTAATGVPTVRRTALLQTLFWLGLALAKCELGANVQGSHPASQSQREHATASAVALTDSEPRTTDAALVNRRPLSLASSDPPTPLRLDGQDDVRDDSVDYRSSSSSSAGSDADDQQNADRSDRRIGQSMPTEKSVDLRSPNKGALENDNESTISDVIVVVAVDGTIAGISRSTGETLWNRIGKLSTRPLDALSASTDTRQRGFRMASYAHTTADSENTKSERTKSNKNTQSESPIMEPLLSTTTTTKSSSNAWQTAAVPGIDGNVFLTAADVTVSTSAQELVERSPFLDTRGRFYIGSRHSSAAALDGDTGEVLHVVSSADDDPPTVPAELWEGKNVVWIGRVDHSIAIHEAQSGKVDVKFSVAEIMSVSDMVVDTGKETWKPTSRRRRRRATKHNTGQASSMLDRRYVGLDRESEETHKQRSSSALSSIRSPAADDGDSDDDDTSDGDDISSSSSGSRTSSLIATPNGNLAFRDTTTGKVEWVSCESFNTPIVFALESSTGLPLDVDIIQDVPIHNASPEYMASQLGMQWENANIRDNAEEHTIVGALRNGQLFALPLGKRQHPSTPAISDTGSARLEIGEEQEESEQLATIDISALSTRNEGEANSDDGVGRVTNAVKGKTKTGGSSGATTSNRNRNVKPVSTKLPNLGSRQNARTLPETRHHPSAGSDKKDIAAKKSCNPSSLHFPACLVGTEHRYEMYARNPEGTFLSETAPDYPNALALMDNRVQNVMEHYHPYGVHPRMAQNDGFPLIEQYRDPMHAYDHLRQHNHQHQHQHQMHHSHYHLFGRSEQKAQRWLLKLLEHWIAPTIVVIFVLSFELGRRKRQKEAANERKVDLKAANINEIQGRMTATAESQHVIQVSDEVLGFGGQGTVVYRGMLEGRNVAVKRMLKAYTASADREISLLIESDGHPNVVRYFLKEVRGDFVYLALELCDISLHTLIATLRAHVNEDEQPTARISTAVRQVLEQIANGVRHIHSLRIVHRDLKPANILLAASSQRQALEAQLTPDNDGVKDRVYDTFVNCRYVAKISDMGLGKQLVGQSSFGVSTLADSSLRGQSKDVASLVGMGPGSVGWQAPEVMAQRWTSDASLKSEASAGNVGKFDARTSSISQLPSRRTASDSSSGTACLNDTSQAESGSLPDASPMDVPSTFRTSRSVDIFSLGCIFHSTLIPGFHPFGEWYEREANIMHNRPNTEALSELSIDAHDLVCSMINRDPRLRPSAQQICEHPFFWPTPKRLAFTCDLSDRIEADITMGKVSTPTSSAVFVENPLLLEKGATKVIGTSWVSKLDEALVANVQRFRTYDPSSVRDLLRLIRNKHHHFDELPLEFRNRLRSSESGLLGYFETIFPKLLMHCYTICRHVLPPSDPLASKYHITPIKRQSSRRERLSKFETQAPPSILEMTENTTKSDDRVIPFETVGRVQEEQQSRPSESHLAEGGVSTMHLSGIANDGVSVTESLVDDVEKLRHQPGEEGGYETLSEDGVETECSLAEEREECNQTAAYDGSTGGTVPANELSDNPDLAPPQTSRLPSVGRNALEKAAVPIAGDSVCSSAPVSEPRLSATRTLSQLSVSDVDDIIVWEGSTAARAFGCRGWARSDEEWVSCADRTFRKRDPVLVRCADDSKFRTRLCNHWDESLGTYCPMRRKNKCVFAHGPVELRVKEGKRGRWGKLVDRNGNNSNPCHSGGEDTYGAARSIESVRRVEGKWNTGKGVGGGGGSKGNGRSGGKKGGPSVRGKRPNQTGDNGKNAPRNGASRKQNGGNAGAEKPKGRTEQVGGGGTRTE